MTATEEIPATTTAPAKVDDIIKALSGLESNIDSLNEKIADMKNQLNPLIKSFNYVGNKIISYSIVIIFDIVI